MKAKWVKAAGLLAAGSLVFSAAYIDGKPGVKDTQEVMYTEYLLSANNFSLLKREIYFFGLYGHHSKSLPGSGVYS